MKFYPNSADSFQNLFIHASGEYNVNIPKKDEYPGDLYNIFPAVSGYVFGSTPDSGHRDPEEEDCEKENCEEQAPKEETCRSHGRRAYWLGSHINVGAPRRLVCKDCISEEIEKERLSAKNKRSWKTKVSKFMGVQNSKATSLDVFGDALVMGICGGGCGAIIAYAAFLAYQVVTGG